MSKIRPAEYDAIARLIHGLLDPDDEANADVRRDVEHAPDSVPSELWRDALVHVLRRKSSRQLEALSDDSTPADSPKEHPDA